MKRPENQFKGVNIMNTKKNKIFISTVLGLVLVFAMAGNVFAGNVGWWNKSVNIDPLSTHTSSYYDMGTSTVGTKGDYAHSGDDGTATLRITPQYKYNGSTYSSHPKSSTINATSTPVDKQWTLDGAFETRFKLYDCHALRSIFSTNVGYYYVQ